MNENPLVAWIWVKGALSCHFSKLISSSVETVLKSVREKKAN